jgi:pyrimidine and pyridine-specific 5'-nucleotidase
VKLLGVERFFEGITYCDYAQAEKEGKLMAKPHRDMFWKAMKEAGARKVDDCYFVGKYLCVHKWNAVFFRGDCAC